MSWSEGEGHLRKAVVTEVGELVPSHEPWISPPPAHQLSSFFLYCGGKLRGPLEMRLFEEHGLPRYLREGEGQPRDPLPSPTSFLTLRYLLRRKNSSVTCPFLLPQHRIGIGSLLPPLHACFPFLCIVSVLPGCLLFSAPSVLSALLPTSSSLKAALSIFRPPYLSTLLS